MKTIQKLLLKKTIEKFGGVAALSDLLKDSGLPMSRQLMWNNLQSGKIPLERAFKLARILQIHPALLNFEGAELILDKKFSIPKLIEGSGFSDVAQKELFDAYNKELSEINNNNEGNDDEDEKRDEETRGEGKQEERDEGRKQG